MQGRGTPSPAFPLLSAYISLRVEEQRSPASRWPARAGLGGWAAASSGWKGAAAWTAQQPGMLGSIASSGRSILDARSRSARTSGESWHILRSDHASLCSTTLDFSDGIENHRCTGIAVPASTIRLLVCFRSLHHLCTRADEATTATSTGLHVERIAEMSHTTLHRHSAATPIQIHARVPTR